VQLDQRGLREVVGQMPVATPQESAAPQRHRAGQVREPLARPTVSRPSPSPSLPNESGLDAPGHGRTSVRSISRCTRLGGFSDAAADPSRTSLPV
jgi:hypothetical protein